MSTNENAVGVAAKFRDVAGSPRECGCHVFDLRRELVFWPKPVTWDNGGDPFARVTIAERWILSAIAGSPCATMHEEKHGYVLLFLGQINIEFVLRFVFRFAVGVNDMASHDDVGLRVH